jgi:hypothetical protein
LHGKALFVRSDALEMFQGRNRKKASAVSLFRFPRWLNEIEGRAVPTNFCFVHPKWRVTADEDGHIVSPWRYDAGADVAHQSARLRQPDIALHLAGSCQARARLIGPRLVVTRMVT